MASSYKRYRQYQENRHRYKVEQIATPIAMMLIIGFVTEYWWVLVAVIIALLFAKHSKNNTKQKENINYLEEDRKIMSTTKNSTETGYINKNNQRNNGKTDIPGTGFGQWFYNMECLNCGHKYHANGHDVWLRKCPKCQGGRP